MQHLDLKIGDRITFVSPTRSGAPRLTRVIKGFTLSGKPTVRAHGYANFMVRPEEIESVQQSATVSA
jgi:hypothetical protein